MSAKLFVFITQAYAALFALGVVELLSLGSFSDGLGSWLLTIFPPALAAHWLLLLLSFVSGIHFYLGFALMVIGAMAIAGYFGLTAYSLWTKRPSAHVLALIRPNTLFG